MPYYLSEFIGRVQNGILRCSAVGADEPGSAIIDLRPDGGATIEGGGLNACLLYTPTPIVGEPRVIRLADLPDDTLSANQRTVLASRLGLPSLVGIRFQDIVGEVMMAPPVNGWKPLRPEAQGTRYAAYLGPLVWTAPVIAGGAVLATDNFNRADATTLGANWSQQHPGYNGAGPDRLGIQTNQVDVNLGADSEAEWYNAITWPDDQYSSLVIQSIASGLCYALARAIGDTTTATFYDAGHDVVDYGDDFLHLQKWVSGTNTALANGTTNIVNGDTLRVEAQGTTIRGLLNGVTDLSVTDTAITSGKAGIMGYATAANTIKLDTWEGGDFAAGGSIVAPRLLGLLGVGA